MAGSNQTRTVGVSQFMPTLEGGWKEYQGSVYRCPVYLDREEDGGFSVVAANLPGVASQGDTEAEALQNIMEALSGAIAVYREDGAKIPWQEQLSEPEPGSITRWVVVHV